MIGPGDKLASWLIVGRNGRRAIARCLSCGAQRVLALDNISACSCQPRRAAQDAIIRERDRAWRRDRSWEPGR